MSDIAIKVEGLGKRYHIGSAQEKYRTFRDSVSSALTKPVRTIRSLSHRNGHSKRSESIWALKDVSFEINRGDVVGVVGRNGAGKSTLLKILSRITDPTEGLADIHGKVGSLLEVGTGFHPELTGRENTYLNGAILGMGRKEINRKFDEIVAFAEIEKFTDTPVKHYSSGMYLRLAFAVAAHLGTEILLVDEVLAVGDAIFQKKCLGKMSEAAKKGRTVLFVSHNMGAIQSLCTTAIFLENGRLADYGKPADMISKYLNESTLSHPGLEQVAAKDRRISITRLAIEQNGIEHSPYLSSTDSVKITINYKINSPVENLLLGFDILSGEGTQLFRTYDSITHGMRKRMPGEYTSVLVFPPELFQHGIYFLDLVVGIHREGWITRNEVRLKLTFAGARLSDVDFPGVLSPVGEWQVNHLLLGDRDRRQQLQSTDVRNLR